MPKSVSKTRLMFLSPEEACIVRLMSWLPLQRDNPTTADIARYLGTSPAETLVVVSKLQQRGVLVGA